MNFPNVKNRKLRNLMMFLQDFDLCPSVPRLLSLCPTGLHNFFSWWKACLWHFQAQVGKKISKKHKTRHLKRPIRKSEMKKKVLNGEFLLNDPFWWLINFWKMIIDDHYLFLQKLKVDFRSANLISDVEIRLLTRRRPKSFWSFRFTLQVWWQQTWPKVQNHRKCQWASNSDLQSRHQNRIFSTGQTIKNCLTFEISVT